MTPAPAAVPLSRRIDLPAITALFRMTLVRHCRVRRLLVLGLLLSLPAVFATVVRVYAPHEIPDRAYREIEQALIFYLIPHALVPLTALVFATGLIQDEIEEQTLTYLFMRPLPRWAIYVTKLAATVVVTVALSSVFTLAAFVAIHWGRPDLWSDVLASRAPKAIGILALAMTTYTGIFACPSLWIRRFLFVGVAYIVLLEGVMANIDFSVRKLTVMYYFRVLCERWLGLNEESWSIDLATAPSALDCVLTLAGVILATTALAAYGITTREFRVKTPEGN